MRVDKADPGLVDELLDELLPESFDWRYMVRTYPLTALAVAATGGYWLGRRHGPAVVSAVSAFAVREVTTQLDAVLGSRLGASLDEPDREFDPRLDADVDADDLAAELED